MALTKLYEVTCDYCGTCLNHYIGNKPSMMELRKDGFVATRTRVFCNRRCLESWEHEMDRNDMPFKGSTSPTAERDPML